VLDAGFDVVDVVDLVGIVGGWGWVLGNSWLLVSGWVHGMVGWWLYFRRNWKSNNIISEKNIIG
jgi:hypothetical protein